MGFRGKGRFRAFIFLILSSLLFGCGQDYSHLLDREAVVEFRAGDDSVFAFRFPSFIETPVDVLFVLDNSTVMTNQEVEYLRAGAKIFSDRFIHSYNNMQVGVVYSDLWDVPDQTSWQAGVTVPIVHTAAPLGLNEAEVQDWESAQKTLFLDRMNPGNNSISESRPTESFLRFLYYNEDRSSCRGGSDPSCLFRPNTLRVIAVVSSGCDKTHYDHPCSKGACSQEMVIYGGGDHPCYYIGTPSYCNIGGNYDEWDPCYYHLGLGSCDPDVDYPDRHFCSFHDPVRACNADPGNYYPDHLHQTLEMDEEATRIWLANNTPLSGSRPLGLTAFYQDANSRVWVYLKDFFRALGPEEEFFFTAFSRGLSYCSSTGSGYSDYTLEMTYFSIRSEFNGWVIPYSEKENKKGHLSRFVVNNGSNQIDDFLDVFSQDISRERLRLTDFPGIELKNIPSGRYKVVLEIQDRRGGVIETVNPSNYSVVDGKLYITDNELLSRLSSSYVVKVTYVPSSALERGES